MRTKETREEELYEKLVKAQEKEENVTDPEKINEAVEEVDSSLREWLTERIANHQ